MSIRCSFLLIIFLLGFFFLSYICSDLFKKIIVWNDDNLTSQLPLRANSQASLTLYANTSSDILSLPDLTYSIGMCGGGYQCDVNQYSIEQYIT